MQSPSSSSRRLVEKAARIVKRGGVVAFPTETVYGLGANALNPKAVRKIFKLKGRPADNPLIVHIAKKSAVGNLVRYIPKTAARLMDKFWPGPLTIVFEKSPKVPSVTAGGLRTVAIRMPDHKIARALIRAARVPIAAPSANRSGRPSPTSAEMVRIDFGNRVLIIDGGKTTIGLESTVIDCTGNTPHLLRPGAITRKMLERTLRMPIRDATKTSHVRRSPGMRYRHYAPESEVIVVKSHAKALRIARKLVQQGKNVGVASTNKVRIQGVVYFKMPKSHVGKAKKLYETLRAADTKKLNTLIVEGVPKKDLGEAIMDRLERAARKD